VLTDKPIVMKRFLIVLLVLTILQSFSHAQSIRFVDTVTVEGYFYVFATNGVYQYRKPSGPLANDCYFVAEKDLRGTTLYQYLQKVFTTEGDTVKYLSTQVPQWLDAYRLADTATKIWKEKVITVEPFKVGQRALKFGHPKHRVFVVRGRVRWLHLRMPGRVTCEAGFNRPPSLDCRLMEKRDCNVYLPLETLVLERRIRMVQDHR
jgi:hypothetical protein